MTRVRVTSATAAAHAIGSALDGEEIEFVGDLAVNLVVTKALHLTGVDATLRPADPKLPALTVAGQAHASISNLHLISPPHQGTLVRVGSGAQLRVVDCHIEGGELGIEGRAGSTLIVEGTSFEMHACTQSVVVEGGRLERGCEDDTYRAVVASGADSVELLSCTFREGVMQVMVGASTVRVEDSFFSASPSWSALSISKADALTVTGCTFENSGIAISTSDVLDVTVQENRLTGIGRRGVDVSAREGGIPVTEVLIAGNEIVMAESGEQGIVLTGAVSGKVIGNNVVGGENSLLIRDGAECEGDDNSFVGFSDEAIWAPDFEE